MKAIKNTFRLSWIYMKLKPFYVVYGLINIILETLQLLMPIGIVQIIIRYYEEQRDYKEILLVCLVFAIVFYCINLTYFYLNKLSNRNYRDFHVKYESLIFNKLKEIDYEVYQSSSFLNDYTRALDDGPTAIVQSFWAVSNIISKLIGITTIFTLFATLHWLIIVYAIIVGILFFFMGKYNASIHWKLSESQKQHYRKRGYIRRMFYLKDSSEDIRTSEIKDVFLDINDEEGNHVIKNSDKYLTKRSIVSSVANFLVRSIYPFALAFISYYTLEIGTIANFSALVVAAGSLSSIVLGLADSMAALTAKGIQGEAVFRILNQHGTLEISGTKEVGTLESLEIEHIDFSYGDRAVLNDINLKINKGDKIAIVGSNGAGKTTLVKLLLRLYDVKNGQILYNGNNYKDIKPNEIRKRIGAVFQDFEIYALTIAENILLRKVENEEDEALVIEALNFSGLINKVNTFPKGIHTEVTKEFNTDGIELSGGEKQKLALSRVYAGGYDLIIMDEPNSALDPLAEADLYEKMMKLSENHTLIFISHRLSTTIKADQIYLFEEGRIIESGSHQELMSKTNGKYRYMFNIQSENYVSGGTQ